MKTYNITQQEHFFVYECNEKEIFFSSDAGVEDPILQPFIKKIGNLDKLRKWTNSGRTLQFQYDESDFSASLNLFDSSNHLLLNKSNGYYTPLINKFDEEFELYKEAFHVYLDKDTVNHYKEKYKAKEYTITKDNYGHIAIDDAEGEGKYYYNELDTAIKGTSHIDNNLSCILSNFREDDLIDWDLNNNKLIVSISEEHFQLQVGNCSTRGNLYFISSNVDKFREKLVNQEVNQKKVKKEGQEYEIKLTPQFREKTSLNASSPEVMETFKTIEADMIKGVRELDKKAKALTLPHDDMVMGFQDKGNIPNETMVSVNMSMETLRIIQKMMSK